MHERTHDGRALRLLTVLDEYTWEGLAIVVERHLTSHDVLSTLGKLFVRNGTPMYIRSDNGSEFTAKAVRGWLERLAVGTLLIEPGSPRENGYIESFNGKLRDELRCLPSTAIAATSSPTPIPSMKSCPHMPTASVRPAICSTSSMIGTPSGVIG